MNPLPTQAENSRLVPYEPYLAERDLDPLRQSPHPVSELDYGPLPLRIVRLFKWGLRMNAGFGHGHPGTWNNLRLPPMRWSDRTRGSRAVSAMSRQNTSGRDAQYVPSVFVPASGVPNRTGDNGY